MKTFKVNFIALYTCYEYEKLDVYLVLLLLIKKSLTLTCEYCMIPHHIILFIITYSAANNITD